MANGLLIIFFPLFVSRDELKENWAYCNRILWEVKTGEQLAYGVHRSGYGIKIAVRSQGGTPQRRSRVYCKVHKSEFFS